MPPESSCSAPGGHARPDLGRSRSLSPSVLAAGDVWFFLDPQWLTHSPHYPRQPWWDTALHLGTLR
eukprot:5881083-Amphidinium_carterae.1